MGQGPSLALVDPKQALKELQGWDKFLADVVWANTWCDELSEQTGYQLSFRVLRRDIMPADATSLLWRIADHVKVAVTVCSPESDAAGAEPEQRTTLLPVKPFYAVFVAARELHGYMLSTASAAAQAASAPDAAASATAGATADAHTGTGSDSGARNSSSAAPKSPALIKRRSADENECQICMERPVEVVLSCAHCYCESCITSWQQLDPTCPMCRADICRDGDQDTEWRMLHGEAGYLSACVGIIVRFLSTFPLYPPSKTPRVEFPLPPSGRSKHGAGTLRGSSEGAAGTAASRDAAAEAKPDED